MISTALLVLLLNAHSNVCYKIAKISEDVLFLVILWSMPVAQMPGFPASGRKRSWVSGCFSAPASFIQPGIKTCQAGTA